ncbi:MAG: hypothetical protein J5449_04735 [Oscillospiraceae bacterium]|nr:hypothetical protein [Oscillospiraceae bacterium]
MAAGDKLGIVMQSDVGVNSDAENNIIGIPAQEQIAPVWTSGVRLKGSYFAYKADGESKLYLATSSALHGEAPNPGVNCEEMPVGEALKEHGESLAKKPDSEAIAKYVRYTSAGTHTAVSAGELFVYEGILYKATVAIGAHTPITPDDGESENPNCVKIMVADELSKIYGDLGSEFDSSASYFLGMFVLHDGKLYYCSNPSGHTGARSDADFTQTDLCGELGALNAWGDAQDTKISNLNADLAPAFDATQTYSAGTYVRGLDDKLYRLTAAHAANVTWANTSKVAVEDAVAGAPIGKAGYAGLANYLPTLFAPAGYGLGTAGIRLNFDGADLNELTTFGLYCWGTQDAPQNIPLEGSGGVVVPMFITSAGFQIAATIDPNNTTRHPRLWIRQKSNNDWSSTWFEITST